MSYIIAVIRNSYKGYFRNTYTPLGRWNTIDNSVIKADLASMDCCCFNKLSKKYQYVDTIGTEIFRYNHNYHMRKGGNIKQIGHHH